MKPLSNNRVNRINDDVSVIPLNLQDHLILYREEVIGMYHKGHETVRLFDSQHVGDFAKALEIEDFEVQYSLESFVLSQWTGDGHETCGKIIYDRQDHPIT